MSIKFDGVWTGPQINGAPIFRHEVPELPKDPTTLVMPMMSPFSVYAVPTAGTSTAFAGLTWYILGDSGFTDVGAGVWRFTREWIRKPAAFESFEVYAANFPGIRASNLSSSGVAVRDPQLVSQTSKLDVEFFMIMPTGGDYTTAALIPITEEARLVYDETNNSAPLLSNVYLSSSNFFFQNTTPSPASYQALIAASTYSIQAEASSLSRVRGPLWRRENRLVRAK
jgi:hypothetical protein